MSSYEKSFGRDLLGEELSALSFWLAFTKKSALTFEEFSELLSALRFEVNSMKEFKSEFSHVLFRDGGHGELTSVKDEAGESTNVFRFDLARRIFLERGL